MQIFDRIAKTYDAWYDTDEGKAIFNTELKCLESLCRCHQSRWLEVGTGAGRFASGLGVSFGIDPSIPMPNIAAKRGVAVCAGRIEELPFPSGSIDGVLLAMTLCFISDPGKALKECCRILRPEGLLLLGIVPAESSWGLEYQRKKAEGHPVYSLADFAGVIKELQKSMDMTGAKILAQSLLDLGIECVFGYTGAAILPVMDELAKSSCQYLSCDPSTISRLYAVVLLYASL